MLLVLYQLLLSGSLYAVHGFAPNPHSVVRTSHSTIAMNLNVFARSDIFMNPSFTYLSDSDVNVIPEDAFTDEIVLFDDTIKVFLFSSLVFVILALIGKFFLNQMDFAIEKVLRDFESTMKRKYASRWVSVEAKLKGLKEPDRSQKLFEIMEEMQKSEPDFYAKVNEDMGWPME